MSAAKAGAGPRLTQFSSHLWRMVGCIVALAIVFAFYVRSEKQVERANDLRHRSFLLADELRQSGDDLTRMARTYVVTGDPFYRQHFQDILDIRDGKKPRPENYWRPYWDLVLGDGPAPRAGQQAVALLELMRQAGFSEEEFRKLAEAKANSDGLTVPEFEAMKLVESNGPDAETNRARARAMMHDAKYHQAKAAIMKPIDDFLVLVDQRTLAAVHSAENSAAIFRYGFAAFGLGLLFALWRTYVALGDTLGGSVDEVYANIAMIGSGDFSAAIPVKAGLKNSVLGWLSETQAKLNDIDRERKGAAERAAWLASFPERNPIPIVEVDLQRGVIDYANPSAARLFPELRSQGLDHFWLAGLTAAVKGITDGSRNLVVREIVVGEGCYRQDISYIPETQWVRIYGTDITERKRVEEQLRASLKEVGDLKTALDEHAIVAMTDAQGRITCVNDKFCAISKYSREELLGQDHRLINSGHHSTEFIRDLWTTIAHGRVWHGEIKNRAKDGSFYWVDTTIVPFLSEDGKPRQYVAIRADITERKRAEEKLCQFNALLEQRVTERTTQLETANKELESFAYSVSHDLRAPLRGIDGWSHALVEDYGDKLDEKGREYLAQVCGEAQRMGQLIDDLLELSRVTRAEMRRETVDLSAQARTILAGLRQLDGHRQVETVIAPDLSATGDPRLLRSVLENLLGNAWKFTGKKQNARIEFGTVAEVARLHYPKAKRGKQKAEMDQSLLTSAATTFFVRDNGAGFDMAHATKLFAPFQRLHRPSEFPGTGIGLATVQRIIHRHGGQVRAEAVRDQGATFYFTLPTNESKRIGP